MDTLIQWMVNQFGWGALVIGIALYLVIEGGLDIVTGLILMKIEERRNARKD